MTIPYETLYEARFATRYAARLHERSARVWQHVGTIINFIEIIGGSGALAAYFANSSTIAANISLVLAACVAANHTLKPVEKQCREWQLKTAFMTLLSDSNHLTLDEFNQKLALLCTESDHAIELLRNVAYNDVAREHGREEHMSPLSFFERTAALFG